MSLGVVFLCEIALTKIRRSNAEMKYYNTNKSNSNNNSNNPVNQSINQLSFLVCWHYQFGIISKMFAQILLSTAPLLFTTFVT